MISGSHSSLRYWVPRECEIKSELEKFLGARTRDDGWIISGYDGLRNPEDLLDEEQIRRHANYQAVKKLFSSLAGDFIPDMRKGHVNYNPMSPAYNTVDRCLMLSIPGIGIVGAVYFRINLSLRRSLIGLIAVEEHYRRQEFGTALLHSAIFISMLYGCSYVSANASEVSARLFESFGFERHKLYSSVEIDQISFLNLENCDHVQRYASKVATFSRYDVHALLDKTNDTLTSYEENIALQNDLRAQFYRDLYGFLKETDLKFQEQAASITHAELMLYQYKQPSTTRRKQVEFQIPDDIRLEHSSKTIRKIP